MSIFFIPVMYDETGAVHRVAPNGYQLDPNLVPISAAAGNKLRAAPDGMVLSPAELVSAAAGNALATGADGGLFVARVPTDDLLSADALNQLTAKSDGLYFNAGEHLSDRADNLLQKDGLGNIFLTKDGIVILSLQQGNYLRYGNDRGMFIDGNDILSNQAGNALGISPIDGKIFYPGAAIPEEVPTWMPLYWDFSAAGTPAVHTIIPPTHTRGTITVLESDGDTAGLQVTIRAQYAGATAMSLPLNTQVDLGALANTPVVLDVIGATTQTSVSAMLKLEA